MRRFRTPRIAWRLHIGRVAILISTLLAVAALAEIGTRLFTKTCPPLTLRDPAIGIRYLESFEGEPFVDEVGRRVPLRFNAVGFRGPDRPFAKPSSAVRVAVMGDSMVASIAVEEPAIMTSRLERLLNESRMDAEWEVLNFGVDGASSAQQIALYRKLVADFDPDVVLSCFFVGNDLADNSHRMSNNPRIYYDIDDNGELVQLPLSVSRRRVSTWLNQNSRFYVWQKRTVQLARRQVRAQFSGLSPGDRIFLTKYSDDVDHAWRVTTKAIQTLNEEVTTDGRQFGLVVIPICHQIYDDSFDQLVQSAPKLAGSFDQDHPDRRLREICGDAGVACLCLSDAFSDNSPSRSLTAADEWLFIRGYGHLNERGNEVAAAAVHDFVVSGQVGRNLASRAAVRSERR